jgi:benzoylsuccinyl-CoA thiolase BbsA subunit
MGDVYVVKDFFEKIDGQLKLVGSRCSKCKTTFFPKKTYCSNCVSDENMKVVPLSTRGKLASYSIAMENLMGTVMGFTPPYAFGYVDLPEGIRLFALLIEVEPFKEKLKLNMDVEMVIQKIRQDEYENDVIGYVFKPVSKS